MLEEKGDCFSSRPTGAPFIISDPPKLVCTSTPTVYPPASGGRTLDEVPMPPLKPKARVPVPAPIAPSIIGPDFALFMAVKTCSFFIYRPRISFNPPSLVSPTTGLTDRISGLSEII